MTIIHFINEKKMKQINLKFDLHNPRNAEHYQFHSDILGIITQEFATTQGIGILHDNYRELFDTENVCFLRNNSYIDTPAIEEADRKRDDLFTYIAQTIESNLKCPIASKAEAAKRLNFYLAPYRKAARKSYAENTAEINDFVEKMKQEGIKEDVETLGLTNDIPELDKANKAFSEIYNKRSAEVLTRTTSDNMKTIRPKVDTAYKELVEAVNALYRVNSLVTKDSAKEAALGTVIDQANAIIVQLQDTLWRAGVGPKPSFIPDDKQEPTTPSGGGGEEERPGEL